MDHVAVTLGIQLWDKFEDRMTRGQFESELASYLGRLAHYPPDPRPVEDAVARRWPYEVGHFYNKGQVYILRAD